MAEVKVGYWEDVPGELLGPEVGAKDVIKRVLIGEKEGAPNFVMRVFTIKPGGNSPIHSHSWEHEIFVYAGEGVLKTKNEEIPIKAGNFVYVPPNAKHGFVNTSNEKDLILICVVPKIKQ